MMFKRKGGEGVKGLLNNVKKTALFLKDGFPRGNPCREQVLFDRFPFEQHLKL